MDYELFQVSAVKAFGHCRDVKAMVSDMQQVLSAVPGMVRKNERLEKEKAEMRQENAALKAGLDDWKGNAEGFEPDAYMRLPLDADGAAIRPGDKIYFDGDPESEALICVAIGCWPLPVEFMDWGKTNVKGSILLTQGLTVCRDIDLCGECLKSFKRWLKGKEEEGERE